jgi:citrate synthase
MLRGRLPNEAKMLDALLIIPVEHGMVSHVVTARLVYHCAPKAIQAAGAWLKAGLNCLYTPRHYVKENQ